MRPFEKTKHISKCLELAILLEASANKPGNVNRTTSFKNTRYEHFLASAVAISSSFEYAAERGVLVSRGEIHVRNVGLGRIIRDCTANVNAWQHGGNTLLGTAILLSPIAVAAGMTSAKKNNFFKISKLRENVKLTVESTTPEDAVDAYQAIRSADPGGLGTVPELDIKNLDSVNKIHKEKISLYQIFKIASKYDTICYEWVNNYPITFDVAYPSLVKQIKKDNDLNMAIVHLFLKVLAEYPDTLITRKTSIRKAREVSSMAKEALKRGGLETLRGKKSIHELDHKLRKSDNLWNPGTTADITTAALALSILSGYRP